MTIDTKIQLGILIITFLVAFATFLHFFVKWYRKKYQNPKIEAIIPQDNSYPICKISAPLDPESKSAYTKSLATWVKTVITNTSSEPLVLKNISTYEDTYSERPIFGYPVKKMHAVENDAHVSDPIDFPISIPAHSVYELFIMIEITVSKKLGVLISKLYGKNVNSKELNNLREDIKNKALSKEENDKLAELFGIRVGPVELLELSLSFNPNKYREDKGIFHDKLGKIPRTFFSKDVFNTAVDTADYNGYQKSSYQKYFIKYLFSDSRSKTIIFKLKNADWFCNKLVQGQLI